MGLAEKVIKGDVRAAARLISMLEDKDPQTAAEMELIYRQTARAKIAGVTGAPGTGKSSLVNALTGALRKQGKTVGVVAIDPSSASTGGAMLGDRVRMQEHSTDEGVFIRSLATRGWAGGLCRAALGAVHVLDALGRDIVFIETVGAGQVEIDIAAAADITLVVLNPGAGDDIQALKAGILEAADIFVINKADHDGAETLKTDLETMLSMKTAADYMPPVMLTEAVNGTGIKELAEEIGARYKRLADTGDITGRRRKRIRLELMETVEAAWQEAILDPETQSMLEKAVTNIETGRKGIARASGTIIDTLASKLTRKGLDPQ